MNQNSSLVGWRACGHWYWQDGGGRAYKHRSRLFCNIMEMGVIETILRGFCVLCGDVCGDVCDMGRAMLGCSCDCVYIIFRGDYVPFR